MTLNYDKVGIGTTTPSQKLDVIGTTKTTTLDATNLQINSVAVSSTAADLNLLDGSSPNTVVNSKAVIYGSLVN